MDFKGNLGNYKIIETEDGTKTIYSEYFDENCHSLSGAYEETYYNYINGCEVFEKLETKTEITIYEVGFGMAKGLEVLLDHLTKNKDTQNWSTKKFFFHSTELDREFAKWVLMHSDFAKKYSSQIRNYNETNDKISFEIQNVAFILWAGDARISIKNYDGKKIDCIFQDAFSPKKNPMLWTYQWFLDLKTNSDPDVILSTYSSSIGTRASLIKAGFFIENRKGFGVKKSCTRAFLQEYKKQENLHQEIIRHKMPYFSDPLTN